jgi:glycerol-3-phosphate dehydrogenase
MPVANQITPRRLSSIEQGLYDVVVIGGGIMGCGIAWDASLRGLKTILLEKEDFGSKTSSGCFRIVHGGLRYLQHLNFRRVCQSAREQQILRKIAPHLVKPLPFLIPCYGYGMKGRPILRLALTVYETLTFWRNSGVPTSHRLPNHKVLSVEETLTLAPGLNPQGLTGGIIYYDCQLLHCERLTSTIARAAADAGADVFNYAEVSAINHGVDSVESVVVEDKLSGSSVSVRGRCYVNAAGPWLYEILDKTANEPPHAEQMPFSTGIQVVVPEIIHECAIAVESREQDDAALLARGGRSFFMQPWRGRTLIGTSEKLFFGNPDRFKITDREIAEFVHDVAAAYRDPRIHTNNVTHVFGGVRAVDPRERKRFSSKTPSYSRAPLVRRHDEIMNHALPVSDHNGHSLPVFRNLISVEGVKYTTFRSVAEHAVNLVCRKLHNKVASSTAHTPLPGADSGCTTRDSDAVMERLRVDYGSEANDLLKLCSDNPSFAETLSPESEVICAQVIYAVRNEYARRLSDVVFRRTIMGLLGSPSDTALMRAAELMASELGWSDEIMTREIEEVKQVFNPLSTFLSKERDTSISASN